MLFVQPLIQPVTGLIGIIEMQRLEKLGFRDPDRATNDNRALTVRRRAVPGRGGACRAADASVCRHGKISFDLPLVEKKFSSRRGPHSPRRFALRRARGPALHDGLMRWSADPWPRLRWCAGGRPARASPGPSNCGG